MGWLYWLVGFMFLFVMSEKFCYCFKINSDKSSFFIFFSVFYYNGVMVVEGVYFLYFGYYS